MTDLYATLSLPKDAPADAVRRAYRKLAKRHHPDQNPGDEAAPERFRAIELAYRVLSDPAARARYDATGEVDGGRSGPVDPETALVMQVLGPILMGLMQEIVKQGAKAKSQHVVEHLRKALEDGLRQLKKARDDANKLRAELEAAVERFTVADGEQNLLAAAARSHLADIEAKTRRVDAQEASTRKALEYLKKCGYQVEREVVTTYGMGGWSGMWATGTSTATNW